MPSNNVTTCLVAKTCIMTSDMGHSERGSVISDCLVISDAEAESCVCVTLDGEEFLVEFVDVPYDNVSTRAAA